MGDVAHIRAMTYTGHMAHMEGSDVHIHRAYRSDDICKENGANN